MMLKWRKRLTILAILLAVVAVWATLVAERDRLNVQETNKPGAELAGRVIRPKIWKPDKNPLGAPACTRGRVVAGEQGQLQFRARCKTYGIELAYFSLASYPLGMDLARRVEFEGDHVPLVISGGGTDAHGSCTVEARESSCIVHASGGFVASGSLALGPAHRCEGGVSMFVVDPGPCFRGFCRGSLMLRYLALGRPAGC